MNTQEYISSGIIEAYVLGLASPEERAEFERMCAAHAEVRAARDAFESELENHSLRHAVPPPAFVKSNLFAELDIEKDKNKISASVKPSNGYEQSPQTIVVKMNPWWKYVAAASVILFLGSTALNFYFFNQYKEYNARYDELVRVNTEVANNLKTTQARFDEYQLAFEKFTDPGMAVVKMAGKEVATSPDPSSLATVYWDTRTKDVFLRINNMPQPTSDLQYQLWAIVDGVPVDAGVFDIVQGKPLIAMKNIPRAQAFAITLETKGGNPTPKGQMYVLGKVS